MAVIAATATNLQTTSGIAASTNPITAREIDFVTRFGYNWEELRNTLGLMNFVKKTPGAVLKVKTVTGTLATDTAAEGALIPYSQFKIAETPITEMTLEKYAKSTTMEAIKAFGYADAVQRTDDQFLYELQDKVLDTLYTHLNTGSLHPVPVGSASNVKYESFQSALAMAKGLVINKFKKIHRQVSNVIAFVNALDVYDYLGTADITIQTAFGFNYIQNFMGYSTVLLLSDDQIQRGRVIATAVENLNLYYVDPADSDFARAGLQYTTDGETNLIGFHVDGQYSTATSVCYAIMGIKCYSEFVDGIAVIDVGTAYTA